MEVILKGSTSLAVVVEAIRTCWDSFGKSDSFYPDVAPYPYFSLGQKDKKLIETVMKNNHTSTLEHLVYNFKINGISRLVLQEFARHRIASPSVKSSRYTLKELKNEEEFNEISPEDIERAMKYINSSGNDHVDKFSVMALENLRKAIIMGIPNDVAKYCLPECYKVDLMWSVNARSLCNFLQLRMAKEAHYEIRELAKKIYEKIPQEHKFIFEKFVCGE